MQSHRAHNAGKVTIRDCSCGHPNAGAEVDIPLVLVDRYRVDDGSWEFGGGF